MPLQPGQTLAHYRIDSKLGEGGMGEVWAATDTRLKRRAAIKALPAELTADAERLARFNREAQLLAALNHPNIAGVYGLEEHDGAPYLALELVEGDDLTVRMGLGAIPLDETLEVALQIASALEEAHDKGIIHRDLKPANIKVAADGQVKVLDFGLAKALSEDSFSGGSFDPSTSPTLTAAMGTRAGLILGTAAYMSPEQARGKNVDRRADVWAFGVILFEMLTGSRLFSGETVTDVLAAVVTREPDWNLLPPTTPASVQRVLKRCLRKDPRQRMRDIGDVALDLREHADAPAEVAEPRRSPLVVGLAAAAGLALGLVVTTVLSNRTGTARADGPTWTQVNPPATVEIADWMMELSPDGRRIAFAAVPAGGDEPMLWVRNLAEEEPRVLAGTEGANLPFWSPDSRSIAYFAKRRLRRIDADGGPSTDIDNVGDDPRGGHWAKDGHILFVPGWSQPLYRIPAEGGTARRITELNEERFELSHRWPLMLPDGKHFLFFVVSTYPSLDPQDPSGADKSGLYIGSLDGGDARLLQELRSRVAYAGGSMLYVERGVLMARPFDLSTLSFSGEGKSLADGVTQASGGLWGGALFSVSETGSLLLTRGAPESSAKSRLTWFDRSGRETGTTGEALTYRDLDLAADDSMLAASSGEPSDIWMWDLERDAPNRFTFDPGNDDSPIWSPGGDRLVFQSSRLLEGGSFSPTTLFAKASSGLEEEVHLPIDDEQFPGMRPSSWSPDTGTLALTVFNSERGSDIFLYSMDGQGLRPYITLPGDHHSARFSPNGKWVAYTSEAGGSQEIFVSAHPEPRGKYQVSRDGALSAVWRSDGRELFYLTADRRLMAVPVESGEIFRHGTPEILFSLPEININPARKTWDVTSDGQRFVFLKFDPDEGDSAPVVSLLQGWPALLE